MNVNLEHIAQREPNLKAFPVGYPIGRGLRRLRDAGNSLTGGGLRSLVKRSITKSIRSAMRQPVLKALGRSLLQPFPIFSARLYRLASTPDAVTEGDGFIATSEELPHKWEYSLLVNSFYRTAFGRTADKRALDAWMPQLQSGMSLEV